jgi:hypothetical protein
MSVGMCIFGVFCIGVSVFRSRVYLRCISNI